MRLIDADALKDQFAWLELCSLSKNEIFKIINEAPSVDKGYYEGHIDGVLQGEKMYARPIGKWIHDNLYLDVRCSICNSYALERGDYPEFSQYCPACGAKMEVEEND